MLNWFKRVYRTMSTASTGVAAIFKWKLAFTEVARRSGARHYDPDFWDAIASDFQTRWREVEPLTKDPNQLLEKRLGIYMTFLKSKILEEKKVQLTPDELEQVGEFIANASVIDLRHAIFTAPKRVAPIFDLLPEAWLDNANITAEQFNQCYFEHTGKYKNLPSSKAE